MAVGFKIADGYVEVHGVVNRASVRRAAKEAADEAEREGRSRAGALLKWLFTPNPDLMQILSRPIAKIFSTPILLGIAAAGVAALAGFLATAISTAILAGIALGFIGLAAFVLRENKQIEAAYERLSDRVGKSLERAAEPMIGPLVKGMDLIGDWVEKMEPAMKRIFTGVAPMIEPLINGFMGMLNNMLPGIERALPGIQAVVDALAVHMPGLGTAIGDFFATIAENEELLTRVVGLMITWLDIMFKVAGPILIYFMSQFAAMAEAWNILSEAVKAGAAWFVSKVVPAWLKWQEVMFKIVTFIPGLLMVAGVAIKDFAMKIPEWLGAAGSAIAGFFTSLWNTVTGAVTTAFDAVVGFFTALPGRIVNAIMALPGQVSAVFWQVFDAVFYAIGYAIGTWIRMWMDLPGQILGIFTDAWQFGLDATTAGLNAIWSFITTTIGTIQAFFLMIPVWMAQIWNDAWARVTRIVDAALQFIHVTVPTMMNKVLQWFAAQLPRIGRFFTDAWNSATKATGDGANRIWQTARDLPGRIWNAFTGLSGRMFNIGVDIMRGLGNGILSMVDFLVDTARRAVDRIIEGAKDALGIGSPSKVFADQVGKWIPEGIRVGIEKNADAPDQAISDLARPVMNVTEATSAPASVGPTQTIHITNNVTLNANDLGELQQLLDFMNGNLQGSAKGIEWAGNIFESQGQYARSHA